MAATNPTRLPRPLSAALLRLAALACSLAAAIPAGAQPAPEPLSAVVGVHATVPASARTAATLGTERSGSGVVIDGNGLVLTIGYLIMEAERVELSLDGETRVPAETVAYDHATGFGLLRAAGELPVRPMALGDSRTLAHASRVLVAAAGGAQAVRPAYVVARRPFAGYWEYLLENAIFTAPAHPAFGGAALVGEDGALYGIGSLVVPDALAGERTVAGNLFVPVEALAPILGELLAAGRTSAPRRPWLGLHSEAVQGRVFVTRVAEDGPAARAGIEAGDIVLGVGDEPVRDLEAFYRRVWALGEAGVEVPLVVLHGVEPRRVTLRSMDRYAWLRLAPPD